MELQALSGVPTTLVIRCTEDTVEGSWRRDGVTLSKRSVTRAAGDDVVELGHGIAAILIGVREGQVARRPSEAFSDEDGNESPPSGADDTSIVDSTANETSIELDGSLEQNAPPSEAKEEGAVAVEESNTAESSDIEAVSSSTEKLPWSLGAGVGTRYWGTQIPVTVGPVLEGSVRVLESIGVHAVLDAEWGSGRADGFSVREIAPGIHADLTINPWLSVLVGPVLSILQVKGNTASTDQRTTATTGGIEILLHSSTPWTGSGAFAAIGLRGLARPREVRVGEDVVLFIPQWQPSLIAGFQFGGRDKKMAGEPSRTRPNRN